MPDDQERYMSAERKRIVGPLSGRWLVFAISVILTAFYPLVVRAQNPPPNIQYTNKAADLGLRGDLKVNPSTQGLEMQINLGNYPGRAGLSLPVTLNYSSKVHRISYQGYNPGTRDPKGNWLGDGYTITAAIYGEHSASGWNSSLSFPLLDFFSNNQAYDMFGRPAPSDGSACNPPTCLYSIDRMLVWMPDGSSHELRSSDQPLTSGPPDNLYSVDGSRLRYQRSTNTLFLPDGSRYLFASSQYVDRNGNTLTYANGAWTDTLGRVIANPVNVSGFGYSGGPTGTPGDYAYSLPGVGGPNINYTFKWRNLGDPGLLTTPEPLRYIAQTGCPSQGGSNSPYLFASSPPDTYICDGNNLFNPLVLYQIVLPTGQSYTFTYNIYGEIDKVILPTGGYERYAHGQIWPVSFMNSPYIQGNRGVGSRWVSATGSGADEVQWQYSRLANGGQVNITAPDGSLTQLYQFTENSGSSFGYTPDGARVGMTYEERLYSAPDGLGNRQMLRRKLTDWTMTGSNGGSLAPIANRNARVTKQVEILLDTGGSALTKTTTYEYDTTFEFSTGVNEAATNEYDYGALDQNSAQTLAIGSIPIGSLLRRTEKTYLDATNQAYRDRNLLGLLSSVTTKDATGNLLAQSSIGYDELSLLTYGSVASWTDPGTSVRANVTSKSNWLNFNGSTISTFPAGTYLVTSAQYDQCGSVRKTWDARDTTLTNPSQISYLDAFSDGVSRNTYAYPTSITTAIPDSNGTFGSNAAFVATSVYDFNTGRVKSTTDANNQTTSFDYTDLLNRLKTVTRPDSGTTTYNYSDTPGSLYVETLIKQDSTRNIDAYQFFDGLGRPNRAFLSIGNGNYNTTDAQYDNMGRVYRVSNPYVSTSLSSPINPPGYWTTSTYDALGRVLSVTTPDSAVVTTAYAGSNSGTLGTTVLVTDPAGKKRRSLTDALGRLVRVDEPDANGDLGDVSSPVQPTSYAYDVLSNLRQVTQASQQRFFMYDSLSRLIRALNPEQTANPSLNLTDSITSNSQWAFAYSYDANSNLFSRTDARGVVATYTYDGLNRNTSITYTSDAAGTPTVSRFYDGWRSAVYNSSIGNSKGRLWQTETSGSAGTRITIDNYDVMGRPTKQEQQFYSSGWGQSYIVQLGYDLAGHDTSMGYPSGHVVNYNYDGAGRLGDKDAQNLAFAGNLGDGTTRTYSSIAGPNAYDAASRLLQEQFGTTTPIYNKRHYNIRGQLYDIRASTVNDDWDWNRGNIANYYSFQNPGFGTSGSDNNGNLLIQQHWIPDGSGGYTVHQQNYDYDSLNRIKWMDEYLNGATPGTGGQSYSYDRWGNRSLSGASGLNNKQFSIDPNTNRYGVPAGQSGTMTYDAAGNLTTDTYSAAAVTRTYDAENRMTSETQANSYVAGTYSYDGDGRRVKRIVPVAGQQSPVETWQVYGLGGELLAEYAANASPTNPQKEYGYRNGQLLITTDVGTASAPAPSGLAATPPTSGASITLNWSAASGATNYRVERKGAGGSYILAGNTANTSFTDPVTGGSAYLYKVCAADGQNNCTSGYSNIVLGAAVTFPTDPTITSIVDDPTGITVTTMKAAHITELRTAVNAVRALAGLSAATWTNLNITPLVTTISVADVRDLRTNLGDALSALGIQTPTYTDSTLKGFTEDPLNATPIRAAHIRELRLYATRGIGGSGGSGASFAIRWMVSDQLGTPRMIFDQSGSLANVSRHDYLPFGEELFAGTGGRNPQQGYGAGDGVRQHFTKKERDGETGLDYFEARYFASMQGRFTGSDSAPITERQLVNPQDLNRYAYVANNPLKFIDPDGEEKIQVVIQTFIPQKEVTVPVLNRTFGGDDRNVGEPGGFRTQQIINIETDPSKGGAQVGPINRDTGITNEFSGPGGRLIGQSQASGETLEGRVTRDDSGVNIHVKGNESNPRLSLFGITYDLNIQVQSQGTQGNVTVTVTGSHDRFPAYEILVTRPEVSKPTTTVVYQYDPRPTGNTGLSLIPGNQKTINPPMRTVIPAPPPPPPPPRRRRGKRGED